MHASLLVTLKRLITSPTTHPEWFLQSTKFKSQILIITKLITSFSLLENHFYLIDSVPLMSSSLLSFSSDLYCYPLLSLNIQLFQTEILLHVLSQVAGNPGSNSRACLGGTNRLDWNIALELVVGCMSLSTIHREMVDEEYLSDPRPPLVSP